MRGDRGAYSSAATRTSAEGDGDGYPDKATALWGSARVVASRAVSVPHDGAGRGDWVIREIDTSPFPTAPAPRCLVFENDSVVRRVWTYPADWSGLSDAALLRLMGD